MNEKFVCEDCLFSAETQQLVIYHNFICHGNRGYVCKFCDHFCRDKYHLVRHSKNKHTLERQIMRFVGLENEIDDFSHKEITSIDETFKGNINKYYFKKITGEYFCKFCKQIISKEEFFNHVSEKHYPENLILQARRGDKIFLCKLCSSKSHNKNLMSLHIFTNHSLVFFSKKVLPYISFLSSLTDNSSNDHGSSSFKNSGLRESSILEKDFPKVRSVPKVWFCPHCSERVYDRKSNLAYHLKKHHPGLMEKGLNLESLFKVEDEEEKMEEEVQENSFFKCRICFLEFISFKNLLTHSTFAHRTTEICIRCLYCDFVSNNIESLIDHMTSNHNLSIKDKNLPLDQQIDFQKLYNTPPSRYKRCQICDRVFFGLQSYMNHMKNHSSQSLPTDSTSNQSKEEMEIQEEEVEEKNEKKDEKIYYEKGRRSSLIRCSMCPFIARNIFKLNVHINCHKRDKPKYTCKNCTYGAISISNMLVHKKVHEEGYELKFRGVETRVKPQDSAHKKEEEEKEILDKPFSEWNFSEELQDIFDNAISKSLLIQKKKDENNKDTLSNSSLVFHCERCPFLTEEKEIFKKHLSLHLIPSLFQCPFCDYSVSSFSHLIVHRTLHVSPNNNLLYQQSISNIKFLPSSLETKKSSYIPHYSKMFELSKEFLYSTSAPLACEDCPFTTQDHSIFLKHLSKHRNSGKNRCLFCTFSANDEKEFKIHTKLHFNLPGNPFNASLATEKNEKENDQIISKILKFYSSNQSEDELNSVEQTLEISTNKNQENQITESSPFFCKYCSRKFSSQPEVQIHQKSHTSHSLFLDHQPETFLII